MDAESDRRLQNLADNLPGGMIYQLIAEGAQRRFVYLSQGVEALFGVPREVALADGAALYRLIEPEFIPGLAAGEAQSLGSGEPFQLEIAIKRADGERRWMRISSAQRVRSDGVTVWDGIALDITDRKNAEEERERSERRFAIAAKAAALGIWEWDPRTNTIIYSDRAKEICGFPLDQPVEFAQLTAVTHPDDIGRTMPAARRALDPAQRSREVYRYRIIRPDTGEVRWVLAHGEASFALIDGKEVAVSYIGTLLDITDQVHAEQALIESEARLRLAAEAAQLAVWELDMARGTITPSPQLNRLFGFPPEATPSLQDLRSRYAPGERERVEREGAEIAARGETQIQTEFRQIWPDGSEHWTLLRAAAAEPRPGGGPRAIGVLLDITESKRAEERLALVVRELQHRLKNSLAIVQMIALQSFRGVDGAEPAIDRFTGRLSALAAATETISSVNLSTTAIGDVVNRILEPFQGQGVDAFALSGENLLIPSRVAISLAMALHELCTNAVKYGALSVRGGRVHVDWTLDDRLLEVSWREEGGPAVIAPTRKGFGTRLLERGLSGDNADNGVQLVFDPGGLVCVLRTSL